LKNVGNQTVAGPHLRFHIMEEKK